MFALILVNVLECVCKSQGESGEGQSGERVLTICGVDQAVGVCAVV